MNQHEHHDEADEYGFWANMPERRFSLPRLRTPRPAKPERPARHARPARPAPAPVAAPAVAPAAAAPVVASADEEELERAQEALAQDMSEENLQWFRSIQARIQAAQNRSPEAASGH